MHPKLGDLRPLATVDPHLATAIFLALKKTGPAFLDRLKAEALRARPSRAAKLDRARARAIALHDAACLAIERYRTCLGTRAKVVDALTALHAHCAPEGAAALVVGPELVAIQLDEDLKRELPKVQVEIEAFHEEHDADTEGEALEREFEVAVTRLRQGEGKRSTVIEAAVKLRERHGVLRSARPALA